MRGGIETTRSSSWDIRVVEQRKPPLAVPIWDSAARKRGHRVTFLQLVILCALRLLYMIHADISIVPMGVGRISICSEKASNRCYVRCRASPNSVKSGCPDSVGDERPINCIMLAPARLAPDQNCGCEESPGNLAYPQRTACGLLATCTRGRFRRCTVGFLPVWITGFQVDPSTLLEPSPSYSRLHNVLHENGKLT